MSEYPNEIFGNGVTVSGHDVTWFREWTPGTPPYTLTEPFEFEVPE